MRRRLVALALCAVLAACDAGPRGPGPTASPSPSVTPSATPSAGPPRRVTEPEAALRALAAVGRFFWCDPDRYPVQRYDTAEAARRGFPTIDAAALAAIRDELDEPARATYSVSFMVEAWALFKRMRALDLERDGDGWDFDVMPVGDGSEGRPPDPPVRRVGRVDAFGAVTLGPPLRDDENQYGCPICLARGVLIATPGGGVPVERVRVGDAVWTLGADGRRVRGVVLAVGSVPVGAAHAVVDLRLRDGRRVLASPAHPLPDGRTVADLRAGDSYAGGVVASAALVPYGGGRTYDLLPSGPTGAYWAGGVPLGSTLGRGRPGGNSRLATGQVSPA